MERTGGELIQDFLNTFEIPFVFGNPGTTETTFLAAVAASKARYVLSLHESSAVAIDEGYALITQDPIVISVPLCGRDCLNDAQGTTFCQLSVGA